MQAAIDDDDGPMVTVKSSMKDKPPPTPQATFGQLYQFTSTFEKMLLVIATICGTGAGVAQPMMLIAFNTLFTQLGSSSVVSGTLVSADKMIELLLIMTYIGAALFVCDFVAISSVNYVAASQMQKYKQAYLKAVLRQDVGWYDVSNPEELSTTFAEAMVKVQKGLKAQNMICIGLGMGLGSLVMAFLPSMGNPEVAGVTMATVPLLMVAGAVMMFFVGNGEKLREKSYARAGGIAAESLFSMRTITSLGIEEHFGGRYRAALVKVRRVTVVNQTLFSASVGVTLVAYLVMVVVAVLYGSFRLAAEIEASQFPLVVQDPVFGTNVDVHYCADSKQQPANVSINKACESLGLPPLYMTCQLGAALELVGDTPLSRLGATGTGQFDVPPGQENVTLLEALGFQSTANLSTYVKDEAPQSYLNDNPSYYACGMAGANMLMAIFAIMFMGEGFSMAGQPWQHLNLARVSAAKVFAIINRVPAIDSFSEDGAKPAKVSGDIQVKDVVFAYPSSPDTLVCKGYNLSIAAGQTVALCGPSGSGKSTIIQLLERFYDPHSGSITLDGYDIKTLNVRWLRSQMGLVSQEPLLFQGTVAQNIAYGLPPDKAPTQEEIEEAARMANAHGFITETLNDGYATQVGVGGGKLSGGQKQRVAIARAIIKKPAVLLLDEATSALDTKSERVVQAALDEIMTKQKRTTIMIAHRLSTIRNADKIAVLREGSVMEEGTYDSLMTIQDGLFRSLAEKQEQLLALDRASVKRTSSAVEATASAAEAEEESSRDATPEVVRVVEASVVGPATDGAAADGGGGEAEKEKSPIGRLVRLQSSHLPALFLLFCFSMAGSALVTYSFYLMVPVMNIVLGGEPKAMREDAVSFSYRIGLFGASVVASFTCSGFFNGFAGSALTGKLRSHGFFSLMRQEMGYFDQEANTAAELTAFLAEKVDKVKTITAEQLDLIAQLIGACAMFLVVLGLYSDWRLLLAWLAMIAVMGVVIPLQLPFLAGEEQAEAKKKKGQEDTSKLGKSEGSANKIVGDAVMGIRTVASFNLEQRFFDGFAAQTAQVSHIQKGDAFKGGFFMGFSDFVMLLSMGAVFYYSIWLANEGLVDFEKVMTPMWCVMGVMVPMIKANTLGDLKAASKAAVRLFSLFDRTPLIDNLSQDGHQLESVTGDIQVRDVVFSYPSAPDHLVCKGYSLSISAGETLALCGPSGSGKSTIMLLLERFYDPQQGVVTLDGYDIKTLNVRWLRQQLGLVSQEPVLFQGTVAENISYGKQGSATQTEIEEAARMANAHGFITNDLGAGYNTDVGLKGGKLSGGQKQRVAIARAIIKKPSVLLLDEATSALDNESERIVQAALDEIMTKQKRTTIVIAHRLSTIRTADKIAVVQEGAVVEEGTHDELLAMQGLYMNLVLSS